MSRSIARALAHVVEDGRSRDMRARAAAEMIRDAGAYRWAGIFDVDDDEIGIIAHTGVMHPPDDHFEATAGLSATAVRTRTTAVARFHAIVPILGADSGIVVGTLGAECDRERTFSADDVGFLEECAAALRPLYD